MHFTTIHFLSLGQDVPGRAASLASVAGRYQGGGESEVKGRALVREIPKVSGRACLPMEHGLTGVVPLVTQGEGQAAAAHSQNNH